MSKRLLLLTVWLLILTACAGSPPEFAGTRTVEVNLRVDGREYRVTTEAGNVRQLLSEAGIVIDNNDQITPPLHTPLSEGMEIIVVRIEEEIEIIEQVIPYTRKLVRNESMSADAQPLIIQGGKNGRQEQTVRIVYRDGRESERHITQVRVVEPAQDEIVMIGVGAAPGNLTFGGILAYISNGASVILRGNTAFPEQIDSGDNLDHFVFSLSPTGSHLLYTRTTTDTARFNSLWVISTERGAQPHPLEIDNVLWADWNPARIDTLQIAYTTGKAVDQPPGWEANNDLWIGEIPVNEEIPFLPRQIIEAYPATYGWWGGNYAWSPNGQYIAYSYADEVGVIDLQAGSSDEQRRQLKRFTEYNTRADWVWAPSLTWSPDGRFLAFTSHREDAAAGSVFDTWAADVASGITGRFVEQTGMWGHPHWSPFRANPFRPDANDSRIAFLRAANPLDSQRSSYTLWLMDRDGSNAQQLYPPVGENSRFPLERRFMAWSPTGQEIAMVYNNALYILHLEGSDQQPGALAQRITQDDAIVRSPTWAPYGAGIPEDLPAVEVQPTRPPTAPPSPEDLPLPDAE